MANTDTLPQNHDGEFELVLGNKELLTVVFIVVVLLGVFFGMGYVVGRNSAPVETARRPEPYVRTDAPSAMPERRAVINPPAAPAQQPQSADANQSGQGGAAAPTDQQQQAASRATPETPPVILAEPQPGQMFLQVSAVARPEAELLVELLTKKGFRAVIAPGPNEKLFRVLVGPAPDTTALGKMQTDLEQAGFKAIVRKY